MDTELLFESRQIHHVLRQQGAAEDAPCIALQLALTDGPTMYASDGAVINKSAWTMTIRRHSPAGDAAPPPLGAMRYEGIKGKPRCVIDVLQAPERFAALLDMFKGGHASEITVTVDGLADKADYSKDWNTALHATMPIRAIRFEFPLPQSEA